MGLILDTSARVAMERAAESSTPSRLDAGETHAIPAIVRAEALVGVRMVSSGLCAARRRARLEAIRRVTGAVDSNPLVAEHHADIFAELSQLETLIPQNDKAVAATARALEFGVLVDPNEEVHFRRVTGPSVRVLGSPSESL